MPGKNLFDVKDNFVGQSTDFEATIPGAGTPLNDSHGGYAGDFKIPKGFTVPDGGGWVYLAFMVLYFVFLLGYIVISWLIYAVKRGKYSLTHGHLIDAAVYLFVPVALTTIMVVICSYSGYYLLVEPRIVSAYIEWDTPVQPSTNWAKITIHNDFWRPISIHALHYHNYPQWSLDWRQNCLPRTNSFENIYSGGVFHIQPHTSRTFTCSMLGEELTGEIYLFYSVKGGLVQHVRIE